MTVHAPEDPCADIPAQEWLEVMVELERPASDELAAYDRGQRYRVLQANTANHRDQLEEWITQEGLCAEIIGVSDPTAFNILFVRCTADAAQALVRAPGVVTLRRVNSGPENPRSLAYG